MSWIIPLVMFIVVGYLGFLAGQGTKPTKYDVINLVKGAIQDSDEYAKNRVSKDTYEHAIQFRINAFLVRFGR